MSKRPSPKQKKIDSFFQPTRPKKPKLEAGESSTSSVQEDAAVQTIEEGQPLEQQAGEVDQVTAPPLAKAVAKKRLGRSGQPRRNSPRPGPSTAPDGASLESIPNRRLMLSHMDVLPDSSSLCSSDSQPQELGTTRSLEDMDIDDASLMTADSSSSVERDSDRPHSQ